jgi:hypothetical protein
VHNTLCNFDVRASILLHALDAFPPFYLVYRHAVKWLAGEVTRLHCRMCHTIFARTASPAACTASGYTATTGTNVHSYISRAVLAATVSRDMRGSSHQSDAELQKTIGHSKLSILDGDMDDLPAKSLRELLRMFRLCEAFPLAVLRGFVYQCFTCGPLVRRLWIDVCMKVYRFRTAGGRIDTFFGLPGSVMLDPRRTGAASNALAQSCPDVEPRSACLGADGASSNWKVGGAGKVRQAIHQHGIMGMPCCHGPCIHAVETLRHESVKEHHTLALIVAVALGCDFIFNDCTCMLCRHIRANGGIRDLGPALCALINSDVDVPSVAAASPAALPPAAFPVTLRVDDSFATMRFKLAGAVMGSYEQAPSDVPSIPTDFDIKRLVHRLVFRMLSGDVVINGAVVTMHAFGHLCKQYLSAIATPGAGVGHEIAEWLFSQTLSRLAHWGRTMSSTNWRLFYNMFLAFFNQSKALDLSHQLLQMLVRALISLQNRSDKFQLLRAAYKLEHREFDDSFAALNRLSQTQRLASATESTASAATTCAEKAIQAINQESVISALKGIRAKIVAGGDTADVSSRDSQAVLLVAGVSEKGVSLPSISSFSDLESAIVKQSSKLAAMETSLNLSSFNADSSVLLYLVKLHSLATQRECDSLSIQLHLASDGSADTVSKALHSRLGANLKKMEVVLKTLKLLVPLSLDADVRSWQVPVIASITGPDVLPSRIGSIVVIPGDVALVRLVDAFNYQRAAADELSNIKRDIKGVLVNVDAVIKQSSVMLSALNCVTPDFARGAGASGLWGGLPDALFDVSPLCEKMSAKERAEVAAGMAYQVAEGLRIWQGQRLQIIRLQAAATEIFASRADNVVLKRDALGRSHAMRYARELLRGGVTPIVWSQLALGIPCIRPHTVYQRFIVHSDLVARQRISVASASAASCSADMEDDAASAETSGGDDDESASVWDDGVAAEANDIEYGATDGDDESSSIE